MSQPTANSATKNVISHDNISLADTVSSYKTEKVSSKNTKKKIENKITKKPIKAKNKSAKKTTSKTVKHKTAETPASRRLPNRDVYSFFKKLDDAIDEPVTELEYTSNFELLIAVILSAQATDVSVNLATRKLYPVANTPEEIYALGVDGLKEYIKTIGLYNSKANNVIKACYDLMTKHNSIVPDNRKDLEALAGVGRKTANVVLNTAFGQPTMAVDTHIFRVSNRTGLATGKTVLAVEHKLLERIPSEFIIDAHHYLILHGRYTCQARTPKCYQCPVYQECMFKDKHTFID